MAAKEIDEPRNTTGRGVSVNPVSRVILTVLGSGMGSLEIFKGKVSVQFLIVFGETKLCSRTFWRKVRAVIAAF